MKERILFMIINDKLYYSNDNNIDHKEWYISLGYNPDNFESITRGLVIDEKIIFYKGLNFNYDEEVINNARKYGQIIKNDLNIKDYKIYCGLIINSFNQKLEPIMQINDNELIKEQKETIIPKKEKEEKAYKPILEIKNNYKDQSFIKRLLIITSIVLFLSIISKVFLLLNYKLNTIGDFLLVIIQISLITTTIYTLYKKKNYSKYIALLSCFSLILTFQLTDIIISVFYFIFIIDQNYFLNIIKKIKKEEK